MPSREGPVSHTTEGQSRPEVRVATWGSGEPGPMGAGTWTPPPEPQPLRPHKPPTSKPLSPNRRMALFNSVLQCCGCCYHTRPEDPEPQEAEPKGKMVGQWGWNGWGGPCELMGRDCCQTQRERPQSLARSRLASDHPPVGREGTCGGSWALAVFCVWRAQGNAGTWVTFSPPTSPAPAQGAEEAPPVTSEVHLAELEAELEAVLEAVLEGCALPEPEPPPAASPAAAVEPGPALDTMEAPPALEEEPSLGPLLFPASEEELHLEEPTQGQLVECPQPVPRGKLDFPLLPDISVFFIVLILFLCSPWPFFFFDIFISLEICVSLAFIIFLFLSLALILPLYFPF
uniref:Uncharacterized protein n=1 Tax=Pipistrellus kuhlii TaxID=59472 RepID=A0A7J7ZJP4_PIPKU|nr:hypothetical protein mPipKuh1_009600 [Pipistrellus kuhlii]